MKSLAALLTLAWSVAPAAEAVLSRDAIEAALAVAPAPAGEMKTRGLRIQARSEEARSDDHRGAVDLQIAFALNSAALLPQARQQLGELAGALQSPRLAGRRFEVAGHTDSSGPAQRNRELSLARATAVRSFLADMGIDASTLTVAGHGSERPLTGHDAADPLNRRVEIRSAEATP